VKVELLIPAFVAFTFHWYIGFVPPLMGVAVNVTGNPLQEGLLEAETFTLTDNTGMTAIVIEPEVAGLPVAQRALEVSSHLTISPFTGVNEKFGELLPTNRLLTFH
jgi:hypothetical protein